MNLSKQDYDRILKFYRQSHDRHGDSDARSVHWATTRDQQVRFQALVQVADLSGSRILDVGCGLGDLYKFLLQNEIDADYTGIDIVPDFISVAQRRFPQGSFEVVDIFEVSESYDFVLASGALSFKVADNQNYYQDMIKKMYDTANKAVAFNMLDNRFHTNDETYAAYSPLEIADFCSTVAAQVELVVDYLPQDFAVYLFK